MIDGLLRAFGEAAIAVASDAISEARQVRGGWFGPNIKSHLANRLPDNRTLDREAEQDPLGRARDPGIDR